MNKNLRLLSFLFFIGLIFFIFIQLTLLTAANYFYFLKGDSPILVQGKVVEHGVMDSNSDDAIFYGDRSVYLFKFDRPLNEQIENLLAFESVDISPMEFYFMPSIEVGDELEVYFKPNLVGDKIRFRRNLPIYVHLLVIVPNLLILILMIYILYKKNEYLIQESARLFELIFGRFKG